MPSLQTYYQTTSIEDICITGLAGKYMNVSLCKKVSSDQRKVCYAFVAEIAGNSSLCSDAGAQKDQCYEQYARDMRDVSACDKMTDVNSKDSCYSSMSSTLSDPTICEKIRNINQKDNCYWNMASRLADSTYCNKITSSSQKQACSENLQPRPSETQPPKKVI
ncbi:MAG: hypothetical protein NTU61_03195 [Candidatus Altiarchaeota archaeon]|nr:hypothetical protein [Candidatus Altiarchaeota archaeon]